LPMREPLFSHAADAISVLVAENQEHLCEGHLVPQRFRRQDWARVSRKKLAQVRKRIRVCVTVFCGIGNRTI